MGDKRELVQRLLKMTDKDLSKVVKKAYSQKTLRIQLSDLAAAIPREAHGGATR